MSGKFKIFRDILIRALEILASEARQRYTWFPNAEGDMSSFDEDVNNLLDDAQVFDAIEDNQIIYDRNVTAALRELRDAVMPVDEYRDPEEIINDPLMRVVREKAARVLELIKASKHEGNTVEFWRGGEPEKRVRASCNEAHSLLSHPTQALPTRGRAWVGGLGQVF